MDTNTILTEISNISALHTDDEFNFENELTKLAEQLDENGYKELTSFLTENINKTVQLQTSFAVFFLICTYERRMKNISKLEMIITKYEKYFKQLPLINHLKSLLFKEMETNEAIKKEIFYARIVANQLQDHPGVLHHYAEAIIHAKEIGLTISDKEIDDALEKVDEAITIFPEYAKYYCTKGRILAAKGEFQEAKENIRRAIDQESSNKKDYAIRINDYHFYLNHIKTIEFSSLLSEKIQLTEKELLESKTEINETISKLKSENLQMLGFFTAIISFTIGSINFIGDRSFLESALLILILASALVLAVAGFGLIFQHEKLQKVQDDTDKDTAENNNYEQVKKHKLDPHIKRTIIVSMISFVVIIGSIATYYYYLY